MKILRLRHGHCERNLADVTRDPRTTGPHGVTDGLWVTPRPNVDQKDHYPGGLADGRTYRWDCRCGRTVQRRHARIGELWTEHAWDEPDVVVATLWD